MCECDGHRPISTTKKECPICGKQTKMYSCGSCPIREDCKKEYGWKD